MGGVKMSNFQRELSALINKHSMENDSDTPDYLLAEFLIGCLNSYNRVINARDNWYGPKHDSNAHS